LDDQTELRQQIVSLIPRLRRFARGLCGNQADADDLVQVALEKALTRLHQFEPGSRLDSWLYRIVQNGFLDERRKLARREEGLEMDVLERLPDAAVPDDAARLIQIRDADRALSALPSDQRALVVLVLVEGYSYKEAAEALRVPIGTVMSRLSRARKALLAGLEEGEE